MEKKDLLAEMYLGIWLEKRVLNVVLCGLFIYLIIVCVRLQILFPHTLSYVISKSVLLLLCNSSWDNLLATCKLLEKVPNKIDELMKF